LNPFFSIAFEKNVILRIYGFFAHAPVYNDILDGNRLADFIARLTDCPVFSFFPVSYRRNVAAQETGQDPLAVGGETLAQEQRDADNTQLATQFNRYIHLHTLFFLGR